MSFARWNKFSDVYIYDSSDGFVCIDIKDGYFTTRSASEMVEHLLHHREQGLKVPQHTIDEIRAEPDILHTICEFCDCSD